MTDATRSRLTAVLVIAAVALLCNPAFAARTVTIKAGVDTFIAGPISYGGADTNYVNEPTGGSTGSTQIRACTPVSRSALYEFTLPPIGVYESISAVEFRLIASENGLTHQADFAMLADNPDLSTITWNTAIADGYITGARDGNNNPILGSNTTAAGEDWVVSANEGDICSFVDNDVSDGLGQLIVSVVSTSDLVPITFMLTPTGSTFGQNNIGIFYGEANTESETWKPHARLILTVASRQAANPHPADGSTGVPVYDYLSWNLGIDATSHNLYFGEYADTSLTDTDESGQTDLVDFVPISSQWGLTNCSAGNGWCNGADYNQDGTVGLNDLSILSQHWLGGIQFLAAQQTNTYDPPGDLQFDTTYHWRVDADEGGSIVRGELWSFTTPQVFDHKLPLPAHCDAPLLLEGENHTAQAGGWAYRDSWAMKTAENNDVSSGEYLEWNGMDLDSATYEVWFSAARDVTYPTADYTLYAGTDTNNMRQVAQVNMAWDGSVAAQREFAWSQMSDAALLATDTMVRWETNSTGQIMLDCVMLARVPDSPAGFGRTWAKNHPFTLMALSNGSTTWGWNASDYKNANMNTNFLWEWQFNSLSLGYEVGLPWVFNVQVRQEVGWTELSYALQEHINSTYQTNPAGCWGWHVWDEIGGRDTPKLGPIVDWIKSGYPNTLVYCNAKPDTGTSVFEMWGDDTYPPGYNYNQYLDDIIQNGHVDVISYDQYPFHTPGTNNIFPDASAVRSRAMIAGIPYWTFIQTFGNNDTWRIPSESDVRMQTFVHLTYGFTGIQCFTYQPSQGPAMVDADGVPQPMYYYVRDMFAEIANLGDVLQTLESTAVRYVPGKVASTRNSAPSGIGNWAYGSGGDLDLVSLDLDFTKPGNEGLDKNGCIGLFVDGSLRRYFMLTNIYHDGTGTLSPAELALDFVLGFDIDIDSVIRRNRLTGQDETIYLTNHTLELSLPGGTGDLFWYHTSP